MCLPNKRGKGVQWNLTKVWQHLVYSLHLERWSPLFQQMLALQEQGNEQGNNRAISFTSRSLYDLNPRLQTKMKKKKSFQKQ